MPKVRGEKKGVNSKSISNLRPAKPGEQRAKGIHDPAKRLLVKFGKKEMVRVLEMALTANLAELEDIVSDPNSSAFTVGVAQCLYVACLRGDWKTLDGILERIIGKVTIPLEHGGENAAPRVTLYLPKNGREKEEETKPTISFDGDTVTIEDDCGF